LKEGSMARFWMGVVLVAALIGFVPAEPALAKREAMPSVGSDAQLKRLIRRTVMVEDGLMAEAGGPPPVPAPPAPPPMAAPAPMVVSGRAAPPPAPGAEGITNVQTQGIDEGGIVKQRGRNLIVLRRGRLFSIDTEAGGLKLIDTIDAFPPFNGRGGAWYDEMLVSGDWVIVIGYNYARGGTEINRFKLDRLGRFTLVDTYHLRSDDYYSAENYASRLVGNRLVVYAPLPINMRDPLGSLPGMRRWSAENGAKGGFTRIALARDIHVPDLLLNLKRANLTTYHAVTTCNLTAPVMDCKAQVVLGSYSRTFYVGPDAVYVWTGNLTLRSWRDQSPPDPRGLLYRMPLDGSAPQAAVVWGGPVNQFGMRSDADGNFQALVRSGYGGDAMWEPVRGGRGGLALLSLKSGAFGRGRGKPQRADYTPLPGGEVPTLENRFVGGYLVYAVHGSIGYRDAQGWKNKTFDPMAYALRLDTRKLTPVAPGGAVTRIDQMGGDAILIGTAPGGALRFQALGLDGPGDPAIIAKYDLPAAREGESRSQAFFFRPQNADGSDGILGLPVALDKPQGMRSALPYRSGIFYLNRRQRGFVPLGTLSTNPVASANDNCKASCVDWYGNARPIFLGSRVFALLGYELVEGRAGETAIEEVQRLDFNPAQAQQER
ncbi:MAG TPA: beta-propeller domain-containing protein, partial [Novosphingobium sp.]|nr:beta-propeller domain-containing protein [Novosphingobium sp.]